MLFFKFEDKLLSLLGLKEHLMKNHKRMHARMIFIISDEVLAIA